MLILICLISLSLPGSESSGDRIFYCDARSLATGGASAANDAGINPASFPRSPFQLKFGYNPVIVSEKRGLRVYDNYGNNIGISTIAENTTLTYQYSGSLLIMPLSFFYAGCRLMPVWDFAYDYRYELRDDFYQLISVEEITRQGSLRDLEPMIGLVVGRFSLAGSYIRRFGTIDYHYALIRNNDADSITESTLSYQGSTGRLGLRYGTEIGFSFGYVYTHRSTLSSSDITGDLEYPAAHLIGLAYQPASRIPTRVAIDFGYEKWTEPLLIYKFGVEHYLTGYHTVRYGLCFFPDYNERSVWTTAFCVGYGMNRTPLAIDIAYSYAKRDYSSYRLGLELPENVYISESTSNIILSISYSF